MPKSLDKIRRGDRVDEGTEGKEQLNEAGTLTFYVPKHWLKWAQTYLDL
jgi:hypothetical protein